MRAYQVVGLRVVFAVLCLSGLLLAQRSDRGIITGIVTDPTGSSVTGATVKVRNEEPVSRLLWSRMTPEPTPLRHWCWAVTR